MHVVAACDFNWKEIVNDMHTSTCMYIPGKELHVKLGRERGGEGRKEEGERFRGGGDNIWAG